MHSLDGSFAPAISPSVGWVEIDGEVVVLDPDSEQVHLLSRSGALLWQLLDGETTVDELARDVAFAFDLDAERALEDVSAFVLEVATSGLLADAAETTEPHA